MPTRQAKKQRQRIRHLEQALKDAQGASPSRMASLIPLPGYELAMQKAQEQRDARRQYSQVHPVYSSHVPRLDWYTVPDTHGGFQKGRLWSGYGRGISFELLRLFARRCMLIQAVHSCCHHEMQQLAQPAKTVQDLGWAIRHTDADDEHIDTDTPDLRARCARIQRMFATPHPIHESSMSGLLSRALNDHLTINRVAIELIRDRRGRIAQFRVVDGATILPTYRVIQRFVSHDQHLDPRRPEAYEIGARLLDEDTGLPISESEYVCVMRGELVGTFMPGDLLVWESWQSSDINEIFPQSYTERAIEGIVSWMNAFAYNRNYFTVGNMAEIILGVTGEMEDDSFTVLGDALRENSSGLKGAWRVPIVQLPSQETLQVIKLKDNHRDMQFDEWMTAVASLIGAIYRKHPSRFYLASKSQGQQALFERNREAEIESNEEEGFRINRAFFGEKFTELVRLIDPDFVFAWSGLETEEREQELRIDVQEMTNFRSIDEIRVRRGDQPFEKDWSQIPLNPLVFQAAGLGATGRPGQASDGADSETDLTDAYADIPPGVLARLAGKSESPSTARQDASALAKARQWEEIRI